MKQGGELPAEICNGLRPLIFNNGTVQKMFLLFGDKDAFIQRLEILMAYLSMTETPQRPYRG